MAHRRRIVSSGYTTADALVNGSVRATPGGTAANVGRALASLGWDVDLVGRVGDDPAGNLVIDRLSQSGVNTDHLRRDSAWRTPVLVQEAHRGDHRWRFRCPACGEKFATHRPPPEPDATTLLSALRTPDVFFFDRASRFTLRLAEGWRERGTFVVFEPSSRGVLSLFVRAVTIANIVKFSSQRSAPFMNVLELPDAAVVETQGSVGARFRWPSSKRWQHVDAFAPSQFVDSAGAGDWTTAGLLDRLWTSGGERVDLEALPVALQNGQALGSRACSWEGVFPDPLDDITTDFESFGCPRVISRRQEMSNG
ncbi:PfkB family carbohydrate kinase [Microbacterium sp. 20-116]|uniref:PfkB family carbohydrate kinase n=1 Tax=Microbacterium sp. 20-116 TaxID=3239883 RepID=UPI0034E1D5BD